MLQRNRMGRLPPLRVHLDLVHKRSQHFIHSLTLGLISKLKVSKLEFGDLFNKIEGDLEPTTPKWLKNEKKRDFNNINLSEPEKNHPERKIKKKRTSTENPYFDNELKCPEDTQYRAIFHPANRRGAEDVKHDDGSPRCNN